jgi:membrane protein YdbS with pleckstrin-like domain
MSSDSELIDRQSRRNDPLFPNQRKVPDQDIGGVEWLSLTEGENLVWRGHAGVYPAIPYIFFGILLVIAGVLLAGVAGLPMWILLVLSPIGVLVSIGWYLFQLNKKYAITTIKIHSKTGIFSFDTEQHHLNDVQNIAVNQSPTAEFFNRGDVVITTAGSDATTLVLEAVLHPENVAEILSGQLEETGDRDDSMQQPSDEPTNPTASSASTPFHDVAEQVKQIQTHAPSNGQRADGLSADSDSDTRSFPNLIERVEEIQDRSHDNAQPPVDGATDPDNSSDPIPVADSTSESVSAYICDTGGGVALLRVFDASLANLQPGEQVRINIDRTEQSTGEANKLVDADEEREQNGQNRDQRDEQFVWHFPEDKSD